MENYLTNFDSYSEYFINKPDLVSPNVSYIEEDGSTLFLTDTITLKHMIKNVASTQITYSPSDFYKLIVDGVPQQNVSGTYNFTTPGEHIVQLKLSTSALTPGVFADCSTITEVYLPEMVTQIPNGMFYQCENLAHIHLPISLTTIGEESFCYTSALKYIKIPNNVYLIDDSAFYNSGLKTIKLSDTLSTISSHLFYNSPNLESIIIPQQVLSIEDKAFTLCNNLKKIVSLPTNPPTCDATFGDDNDNLVIYVPSSSVNSYKNANGWSSYADRIQAIP